MVKSAVKSVALIGFLSAFSLATAQAATTGSLSLKGNVAITHAITVTPDATNNVTLNILSGESAKSIANVLEESNNPAGYKITAYSTNASVLKNGSVDQVSYQISYGSGSLVSLPSSASPTTLYTSGTLTAPAANTQNVKISFTGKPSAMAGDYTDVINFAITNP